jgi:hypothetical protein
MPRETPQLDCHHRGCTGGMGRQLLPGNGPGGDEGSARETDSYRDGSPNAGDVCLEDPGKNLRWEHVVQLRSTCEDDKTRVYRGRRLWELLKQSVDECGLTR